MLLKDTREIRENEYQALKPERMQKALQAK